jgi:hypothetical protein
LIVVCEQRHECRRDVLLALLQDTLKEAECCDPLIAIHVATALHRYDQLYGIPGESSDR